MHAAEIAFESCTFFELAAGILSRTHVTDNERTFANRNAITGARLARFLIENDPKLRKRETYISAGTPYLRINTQMLHLLAVAASRDLRSYGA